MKEASDNLLKLCRKKKISISNSNFYNYIYTTKKEALYYSDQSDILSNKDRLNTLLEKNPMEYHALRLKYLLSKYHEINHVVLIVDDIESVGYQLELLPIDLGLITWSCLKRASRQNPKTWSTAIIISCRHYVYRMIRNRSIEKKYIISSQINSQTLESYPIDDEVHISKSVSILEIVQKRVQALYTASSEQKWKYALDVVEHILIKTDSQFGDFILAICTNNVRKSLSLLNAVTLNRRWIQRNYEEDISPGAFSISSIEQFNLKPPYLLRAIILDEETVYNSNTSQIPNILINEIKQETDLISLFVLKTFMDKIYPGDVEWNISLSIDEISNEIKSALDKADINDFIDRVIKYFILKRIFLRSKNQAQDDGIDIDESSINTIKNIYVSKSAFLLWEQLGRSSVLLETLSDDIFIDYSRSLSPKQPFSGVDQPTFERCIKYVDSMVDYEKKMRMHCYNYGLIDRINNLVGSEFISRQLLNGLKMSRNAYYKDNMMFQDDLNKIENKILHAKSLLCKNSQ